MPHKIAALATVVSSRAIRVGHEKSFDAWAERICADAAQSAGHIATIRLGQTQGLQHLLFQFVTQAEAERWKGGKDFCRLTAEADEFSTGLDQVKAGDRVRFELPSEASAAKWKRFVTTWIAVFPVLLTISSLVRLVLKDLPSFVQLIPSSLLLTASLQWVILPRLQRWSRAWVLSNAHGDLRKG